MEFKEHKTLGYMYAYAPGVLGASAEGFLYEHHYVMCGHIGRELKLDEVVHHIDRNRKNNAIDNLMLLTSSEHAKLHAIEDRGYECENRACKSCKKSFVVTKVSDQIYCSNRCFHDTRILTSPTREELEALVWSMPTVKVAEILGISDVAVAKRCKKLGIDKPPRGYWAKMTAGKISSPS